MNHHVSQTHVTTLLKESEAALSSSYGMSIKLINNELLSALPKSQGAAKYISSHQKQLLLERKE